MKINKYTKISINIILIFIIMILSSLIPENMPQFFGDWYCKGIDLNGNICGYADNSIYHQHLPYWHWGWRHWLFIFMGFFLFVVQVVRIINIIDKKEN